MTCILKCWRVISWLAIVSMIGLFAASSALCSVVTSQSGVTAIAGGWDHSIALKGDGTVWAWGDNYYGQLGDGTKVDKSTPVQVSFTPLDTIER